MIEINNGDEQKFYYLDIDSMVDFVMKRPENEIYFTELETQSALIDDSEDDDKENDDEMFSVETSKNVRQVGSHSKIIDVRYDTLRDMLSIFYNSGIENDGGNVTYSENIDNFGIPSKIIVNTFQKYGFLKDFSKELKNKR